MGHSVFYLESTYVMYTYIMYSYYIFVGNEIDTHQVQVFQETIKARFPIKP